ncbi:MAG: M3 family metallopeptidase [Methanospirillum sp.]|uniref:M3 family metallopeptidase n=1 Tax=Methanospirillum sp. TaxID=45200 RepID=UPI00236D2FB5|nr:M3 family metallopeptidase [Methanospirillum sp.]MDD1727777.1 M3 family metallopeptidase [Methanospirillum sp.]
MGRPLLIAILLIGACLVAGSWVSVWWDEGRYSESGLGSTLDQGEPVKLVYPPGEISRELNRTIAQTFHDLEDLVAIPDSDRTSQNTIVRLEEILTLFDDQTLKYSLIGAESPDILISAEAGSASYQRDEFLNSVYLRRDISHALRNVTAGSETEQVLKHHLEDAFSYSELPEPVREELTALGQNLSTIGNEYRKNQRDGNLSQNLALIPRIVNVRQQMATLLGYRSFADYQLHESGVPFDMAELRCYLDNKSRVTSNESHQEAAELLQVKQRTDPGATVVYDYEIPVLRSRLVSSVNQTNGSAGASRLPAEEVVSEVNDLVSRIFGVSITQVSHSPGFAPGMNLYRITTPESHDTRAWYYLWIREDDRVGSTSGRTYYLRAGHESGGSWIPSVSALIVSVPPGRNRNQVLLSPVDLQVLFHEYGHLLRHSLATSRYATLSSGARDPTGYSEVFSLFFEKFLLNPEGLDLLSETKGEGVLNPDSDVSDLMRTGLDEEAVWGSGYIRVYPFFLSLLDLDLHSGNKTLDFISLHDQLYENLTGYRSSSGASSLLANPAFFISDNAGTYWHYVLDEEYAGVLFSRFTDEGAFNMSAGIACRKDLFEPAGSVDPIVLMKQYPGYAPAVPGCF